MRQITASELGKHHVLLASPQFGGQCSTIFARSIVDLALVAGAYRLPFDQAFLLNESLITRARNTLCATFLKSDAKHLLFVDADIGFLAQDAIELLILQAQNPEYDIIGAPYRKKDLTREWCFNYDKPFDVNSKEPVEVSGIGTGFMMIRREVLEKFAEMYPDRYSYVPDNTAEEQQSGKTIVQYFQAEIDPVDRRYLSEDYWFSKRCKEIGIRTWLCPWMKLQHAGTHIFE